MADKIILKRSSILGKRPTNQVIEAGELALNTNSNDPGAFFEVSDGNVVKIGPTSVSSFPPVEFPEKGETWYDTQKGTWNIGVYENAKKVWKTLAAPYLGGSDIVVFVAPQFFGSSDSLENNGQSLPFQSVERALLELTKLKIQNYLSGNIFAPSTEKYVIQLAPSQLPVYNNPGTSVDDFSVLFQGDTTQQASIPELIQFNPLDGGVIVPGNITIKGLDLKKCVLKPSYVPKYKHPGYPEGYAGINEPLSCIFKVAGNVSCDNFSVTDKNDKVTVTRVSDNNTLAEFESLVPHGLSKNDLITISFAPGVDQSTGSMVAGNYYVDPIGAYTFRLSSSELTGEENSGVFISFNSVPLMPENNQAKMFGSLTLYSAHRLSAFKYATFQELADYYTKVQKAFPTFFGGKVTDGAEIVNNSEYVIVAPADDLYPNNFNSNSTRNSSCYIKEVNVRSDYGMTYGDFNGDDVEGFRSLIANACTSVSLQTDPAAYEIYTTLVNPATGNTEQRWWTLVEATYYSLPSEERPERLDQVPRSLQLQVLNQTPIEKIRYHYKNLTDSNGKSFGIVDINNDFRHYGFRARNSSYVQAQSIYTIGCAIGVWSLNGSIIGLTNSTSNFGSVAFKSEGFRGINTIGGAYANAKGFQFSGIQRPLVLTEGQVTDIENKNILSLGSRIVNSYVDPANPNIQILELSSNFLPCYILPFSLKPGSAVWVSSTDCTYRGFFATDGGPTVILGSGDQCDQSTKLRIRYSDSTIPTDLDSVTSLDIPYIRRFKDPRNQSDRSYSFVVINTDTNALPPPVGSVLRLNQSSQTLGASTLKPNVQFDPGPLGGWGRLFTVDNVQTASLGLSPNYNYVVGDSTQDNRYLMTLTVGDIASPWLQSKVGYAQGSYTTFLNRNWYAAENNLWTSVYYNSVFNSTVGPYKIAPTEPCSPYIPTSVLEKQDLVSDTYQGSYASDPNLSQLEESELSNYLSGTYFRGSIVPYTEYAVQNYYDDDDGTDSLGLLLKDQISGKTTVLVSTINEDSVVESPSLPSIYGSVREAPEVVEFYVLSSSSIENPKQTRSILKLEQGAKFEYFQVINLVGTRVTAIRLDSSNSFFPDPQGGTVGEKPVWEPSTVNPPVVNVCSLNNTPQVRIYDPDWANSKFCVFRFFEVMGYPKELLSAYLQPQYWGERFFSVNTLPFSPADDGYALTTANWPIEFNQPSTIIANTHTWAYCGYPFYSQGLPKYQTNDISRKLSYDFLSTATWSGRLTVTGINDKGEIVFFGPQREAITSQFYEADLPTTNLASKQIYKDQPIVEFPGQVVVYTADDISVDFDGFTTTFLLKKGGISIPLSHLSSESLWVQLGGITQTPNVNYTVSADSIIFADAPAEGTTCDIRIVTSEDNEKTLTVVPLEIADGEIDGIRSIFTLTSPVDISSLDINAGNTIVILGGVDQIPSSSYYMDRVGPQQVQITFTGIPPESTTIDIRSICSGKYWARQGIFPVAVYPLDSISLEFSNAGQTTFLLTYQGQPINPSLINTGNLLVSVGGVMQVPLHTVGTSQAGAYEVSLNANNQAIIIFQESPLEGATSDLRIITNAEFLPCINGRGEQTGFMKWGPSVVLRQSLEIEDLNQRIESLGG